MRPKSIIPIFAFGAGSLAFLVPPSMNDKIDTNALDSFPVSLQGSDNLNSNIEIKCQSCPFFEGVRDGKPIYSNTKNSLILQFNLNPQHREFISLNNHPLFPAIYSAISPISFQAPQKPTKDGKPTISSDSDISEYRNVDIGLDMFVETDDNGLSRVRVHILTVSGFQTQADMDIIEFPVYQDPSNSDVYIGEIKVRPPTPAEASSVMCKSNFYCRWKAYFYDTLSRIGGTKKKGCHKNKGGKNGSHKVSEGTKQNTHQTDDKHEDIYKDGSSLLKAVVFFAIVPILVGSITGMLVCFVGLFVGHLVVMAWRRITGKSEDDSFVSGKVSEEEEGLLKESEIHEQSDSDDDLPNYHEVDEKH